LLVSTILTLVIIPVTYNVVEDIFRRPTVKINDVSH